jgi:catechol 2,3-dioxygenase-like lactoylglutathione lyase family enzyme
MLTMARVGVRDLARARAFYDAIAPLFGARLTVDRPNVFGYQGDDGATLLFGLPREGDPVAGNGTQMSMTAPSRAAVDASHAKALELGGVCEGPPGIRGDDPNGFYAAYFRDPDGNKLMAYRYGPPDAA